MKIYLSALTKPITLVLLLLVTLGLGACSSPEEKAQAHLERGLELLAEENYVSASLEFRNAVKFNEKLVPAWFGLSKVLEHQQNWNGVSSTLTKVLELDPENFEANFKLAKLQLGGGNLDEALKRINKASAIGPEKSDVLAARAAVLLRLDDRAGARRDAERALALNPDNPDALAVLAADALRDKKIVSALRLIDRGLATDENNLGLLLFKIRIHEKQKDDKELETTLGKLIAFYPDKIAFRRAMVTFLTSRKRVDEAESQMRELVKADADNSAAALDLVRLIAQQRGIEAARVELDGLVTSNPQTVDFKLALAQLDFGQKRVDEAIALLNNIIGKQEPADDVRKARLVLARMKLQQKDQAAAQDIAETILQSDEKNAEALAIRASVNLSKNDAEAAIADLREALNQQPQSVRLLRLLGRAHELQGAVDLAEDRYAQAVRFANFAPELTLEYINFLNRRGKSSQAEQVLSEAVTNVPNSKPLLTTLARLRLSTQDWEGAEEIAQTLRTMGDSSGISEQIVGATQLGRGDVEKSIQTFKGLYAQSQGAARSMAALVMAYARANKFDEAKAFLQTALDANEKNADALVLLGAIAKLEKKPDVAEAQYKLAIERQPDNAGGYSALFSHYVSDGKLDEAEKIVRAGRAKVPDSLGLGLRLTGVLERKREFDEAIAVYEELLEQHPQALILANNLASLLADYRQDEASAKRAQELSLKLRTTELPHFKDTLGWIAYRQGDHATALSYLKQAVQQLPDMALVRYHLGMTYAALERYEDAGYELSRAQELIKEEDPLKAQVAAAIQSIDGKVQQ